MTLTDTEDYRAEEAEPVEGSMMDRLRAKHEEAVALSEPTVDLPVAGYGGDLVARYRIIDVLTEGERIRKKTAREYRDKPTLGAYWAAVDMLLAACDGLYVRSSSGQLESLDAGDNLGDVRYDERLATGMGLPAGSARETILAVFKGNKAALGMHAARYQRWLVDPDGEDPLLGEA